MNPLSELKERLVYISVAGIQLIAEDFRLKKAIEAMEPLSKKNPVFQKIYTDAQALLHADRQQQSVLLLNLLGIMDAVLYTQAGTGIEGDFIELPQRETAGKIIQMRYSEIYPLLHALTNTGSGRLEVMHHTIAEHPEYFTDYRVRRALIGDLGDSYGEMAEVVFAVLKALATGEAIKQYVSSEGYQYLYHNHLQDFYLPQIDSKCLVAQLKQDFDPNGKRDMEKRVALVGIIAKEKENDWYISLLEHSAKGVRDEAITALGYSKENIPLLLELVKKSRSKETIYKALSKWDIPEVTDFWAEELRKGIKAASYLNQITDDTISDIIAEKLKALLEEVVGKTEMTSEQYDQLSVLLKATVNKTSDQMLQLYQWILDNHKKLPENRVWHTSRYSIHIMRLLQERIAQTVISGYPKKLVDFLDGLNKNQQEQLQTACYVADILTMPANLFYEKWANRKLKRSNIECNIVYQDGVQDVVMFFYGAFGYSYYEDATSVRRKIKEPLDVRWYDFFIKNDWEKELGQLTPLHLPEVCAKVGQYFYQKLTETEKKKKYDHNLVLGRLHMLHKLGWKEWKDIIWMQCKKYTGLQQWNVIVLLEAYRQCVDADTLSAEAEHILAYYQKQSGNTVNIADTLKEKFMEHGFLK